MKKTLGYCTIILLFTAGNVAANGSIQANSGCAEIIPQPRKSSSPRRNWLKRVRE